MTGYTYPISAGTYVLSSSSILGCAPTAGGTATVKWCEYRTSTDSGGIQRQDLPAAVPGLRYYITQGASTAIRLYANGGDTFKGLTETSIYTDHEGSVIQVWCFSPTIWCWNVCEDNTMLAPDSVTTDGTGEDNLIICSLPRYTCLCNSVTDISAAGVTSGGATNGTLKFYFGASSITIHTGVLDVDWIFKAKIMHYGATEHRCMWKIINGTAVAGYQSFSDNNETASLTIKLTGEVFNPAHYITQHMMIIRSSGGPSCLA